MAYLFGTNTIFSTFEKTYPSECSKPSSTLKDEVKECLLDKDVCEDPYCYTKSVDLLDYVSMFSRLPVTYFIFDNGTFDLFYKDLIESDKAKIARAHLISGHVLPEEFKDKIMRMTTVSRKQFYVNGNDNTIFQMYANYPVVYSNILKSVMYKNILIYFIDMPLFSLEQLYIDTNN
jgi:hypothetical protein